MGTQRSVMMGAWAPWRDSQSKLQRRSCVWVTQRQVQAKVSHGSRVVWCLNELGGEEGRNCRATDNSPLGFDITGKPCRRKRMIICICVKRRKRESQKTPATRVTMSSSFQWSFAPNCELSGCCPQPKAGLVPSNSPFGTRQRLRWSLIFWETHDTGRSNRTRE